MDYDIYGLAEKHSVLLYMANDEETAGSFVCKRKSDKVKTEIGIEYWILLFL